MANTTILITADEFGAVLAEPASVPFNQGDSITFTAAEEVSAFLYFSPDAVSILSPQPINPVALDDTAVVVFEFSGSGPGAFYVAATGGDLVSEFPSEDQGNVLQMVLIPIVAPVPPPMAVESSPTTPHQEIK